MPVINLDVLFASIPLEGRAIPIYFEILFPWIIGKASKNLFEVNFVKKLRRILPHKRDVVVTWDRGFAKRQAIKRIINIPGLYKGNKERYSSIIYKWEKGNSRRNKLGKGKDIFLLVPLRFKLQNSLSFSRLLAKENERSLVDCN